MSPGMFDDLREAFREALDNFNKELRRDQVPGTVDELLAGMTRELADEMALIRGLEADLERTVASAARASWVCSAARTVRRCWWRVDISPTAGKRRESRADPTASNLPRR